LESDSRHTDHVDDFLPLGRRALIAVALPGSAAGLYPACLRRLVKELSLILCVGDSLSLFYDSEDNSSIQGMERKSLTL
jgi:hypothetical protein